MINIKYSSFNIILISYDIVLLDDFFIIKDVDWRLAIGLVIVEILVMFFEKECWLSLIMIVIDVFDSYG